MGEQVRDNYFLAVRVGVLLVITTYIILSQNAVLGVSAKMLLLLAFVIGIVAVKELVDRKYRWLFLLLSFIMWGILMYTMGYEFLLIGVFLCYETISLLDPPFIWYTVPLALCFFPSAVGIYIQVLVTFFLGITYFQHDKVVRYYRNQTKEDTLHEQDLKQNLHQKETEMKEEIRRGLLQAENKHLEERAALSQTLHDKLGHNINGSIYQLEAIKVIMEKEPEKSIKMTQAVIDQLRSGMDEIRAILRRERPEKYKLAITQLEGLCKECKQKGVEATLSVEGELKTVPEKYLEIILDNAYEAVSNSMKYAKCSRIEMKIIVVNQLVRCSIVDNGIGCSEVVDGMGLSGMRKRIREVNGIIDFTAQEGFLINMLLPLREQES